MNMYLGDTRLLIEAGRDYGLLPQSKRSSESWVGLRYKKLEIIAFEGIRKFKRGRLGGLYLYEGKQ